MTTEPNLGVLVPRREARGTMTAPRLWRRGLRDADVARMELVALPHALVTAEVRTGRCASEVRCLVDRVLGHTAWFEGVVDEAVNRALLDPPSDADPGVRLPARKSMEECVEEALRLISRRLTLVNRSRKWELVAGPRSVPVRYPYWVLYYRRRGGWDLRVLDAISGNRAGAMLKRSLVTALVDADRACEDVSLSWTDDGRGPVGERG